MPDQPAPTAAGPHRLGVDGAYSLDSLFRGSVGWVWPPCCDLIRVKPFGWRFRTQRVGRSPKMRRWWVPTRRLADAVAKRWVEREGARSK